MRVCVDTNVWVAAFATRGLCADLLELLTIEAELVVGPPILAEVERTLARKLRLPPDAVRDALAFVRRYSDVVLLPAGLPEACRDPDDNHVLAAAQAGMCDLIVGGDRDLLDMARWEGIEIVSPRELFVRVSGPGAH